MAPNFAAYNVNDNELRLTEQSSGKPELAGVFGLRRCAFAAEGAAVRTGYEIVEEWMSDCFEVLRPQIVTKLLLRHFYSYPATDPESVSASLMRDFPSLETFVPKELGQRRIRCP